MHLTRKDCIDLNIADVWDRAMSQREATERSRAVREDLALPSRPKRSKSPDGMTKLERSFSETLIEAERSNRINGWRFEPLKVRLAGRCWYMPDFLVFTGGWPTFVEVKGPAVATREDGIIKLKVAAETYPQWFWFLVRREGRHGWDVREVTKVGIGTRPIELSWID